MAAVVLRCFFLLGFDIVMVVGRLCCCLSGCCRRSPVAASKSPAGFKEERCLVTSTHYPLSGVRISPIWFNTILCLSLITARTAIETWVFADIIDSERQLESFLGWLQVFKPCFATKLEEEEKFCRRRKLCLFHHNASYVYIGFK